MKPSGTRERAFRRGAASSMRYVEDAFYVGVAAALALSGIALFGYSLYVFVEEWQTAGVLRAVISLLDNILLVFIVTEIIHTIGAVIRERVLLTEPFLIVGIVAAIRRLIVLSAEAKQFLGTDRFDDAMLEMSILTGVALLLAGAVFLLRQTTRSEPRPAYEPATEGH